MLPPGRRPHSQWPHATHRWGLAASPGRAHTSTCQGSAFFQHFPKMLQHAAPLLATTQGEAPHTGIQTLNITETKPAGGPPHT